MANVCRSCKEWKAELYWNDVIHANKHHFFKIMLGDFRDYLRVPRKFKDKFKGEWQEKVRLRGPSGDIWTTALVRTELDWVFRNGWESFVKDHGLNDGDFLVFSYAGVSLFDVMIFGPSGCEREDAHFVQRNSSAKQCCSVIDISSSSLQNSESSKKGHETEEDQRGSYSAKHESSSKRKRSLPNYHESEEDQTTSNSSQERPTPSKGKQLRGKIMNEEKNKRISIKTNPGRAWSKRKRIRYLKSNRRSITDKERNQTLRRAKSHSTSPQSCLVIMKPSHVYSSFILTIPKWFCEACLPKVNQEIYLRVPPGRETWTVEFKHWDKQCTLNKGWDKFVLDNNLETDDVCIFSLANSNKENILLDVSIFRVVEETVKPDIC